eukprot:CAMPEP_0197574936 /NCGR_PEP_ID=MMETSP1326-20131121/508_1 /TAXON_ID=1155430 /ORGANISM="Genus nov. species nov., Strain RCC2288" /LENGTH=121 /DNA_ID=CAMNT_0043137607 /DNA_START=64 /DNA_END=429 /DNA_ORIENTATION=-
MASQVLALSSATAVRPTVVVRQTRRVTVSKAVVAKVQVKAVQKKAVKAAAVAVAAAAPAVLAAGQAFAADALFTVAEFDGTGEINEEMALAVMVGGSLAIVTAVLSLVIGSNLFIKNIVAK